MRIAWNIEKKMFQICLDFVKLKVKSKIDRLIKSQHLPILLSTYRPLDAID